MMLETAFEVLKEHECLEYLNSARFGRLCVVTADGRPDVFPVNFDMRGRNVVIVTASPVIQARAPLGHVAFEVDEIDPLSHEGWDVVVKGEGADITDTVDTMSLRARERPLDSWAPGHKEFWLTIVNPEFSGRRRYTPLKDFF